MPELPEVETICRGLSPIFLNARITQIDVRRRDLRYLISHQFEERIVGARVLDLKRRSKYLCFYLDNSYVLVVHFGMSGCFVVDGESLHPHDHVVFILDKGTRLHFRDPRRFGFMSAIKALTLPSHRYFKYLGPEPLAVNFDYRKLRSLIEKKKAPIKHVLLDQRVISGMGNIYVCEALHRSHIFPLRPAGALKEYEIKILTQSVKEVLHKAIEAGGSTLNDYAQVDGRLGYFQNYFQVYSRQGEACYKCGPDHLIQRAKQAGRSTFYCSNCQK
jgi:formamidopyrimidine-DNA glycosylase